MSDWLPDGADTRSLGSTTREWLNFYLGDAGKIYFGLAQDVTLYRSAANLLKTDGDFQAAGYKSSDGSAGATGSFTSADGKTITVKNGLITAIV